MSNNKDQLVSKTNNVFGYKFIQENMTSRNGSAGKWVLNRWKHHKGEIRLCSAGFHACLTPHQASAYVYGSVFCLVEAKGKIVYEESDKFVAESMRVVKRLSPEQTKLLFVEYAIKCSWRVLKIYEDEFPDDKRPRKALLAAKRFLKNPTEENRKAARAAAKAVWTARRAAGRAVWEAAEAGRAAEAAAWAAANAGRAARRAAGRAVWEAATAAGRAAEAAAWAAANAVWTAGRAAEAGEVEWQEKTLNKICKKYFEERIK